MVKKGHQVVIAPQMVEADAEGLHRCFSHEKKRGQNGVHIQWINKLLPTTCVGPFPVYYGVQDYKLFKVENSS